MNGRLAYALTHPLTSAEDSVEPYQLVEPQRDGNLLLSVLAVDR